LSAIGVSEENLAIAWWLALVAGLVVSVPTRATGLLDWLKIERLLFGGAVEPERSYSALDSLGDPRHWRKSWRTGTRWDGKLGVCSNLSKSPHGS
jgi:hypothetical protein